MNLTAILLDARVQSAALAFTCAWLAGGAVTFFRGAREELDLFQVDLKRGPVLELWYMGEVLKAWCLITLLAVLWPVEACAYVDEKMSRGWQRTFLLPFANTWFALTLVSVPVSLYGAYGWVTT